MGYKKKIKKHNKITIWDNGYMDRDEVMHLLLSDNEISLLLLGEIYKGYVLPSMEVLYWDDVELVSSKYNEQTVARMESDQNQTIGDMKKDIIEFCAKQKRKDDEQKRELQHSITILEEIKERLHSEIFYDSNWVEGDGYDQSDFIIGVDIAIDKLKKERN